MKQQTENIFMMKHKYSNKCVRQGCLVCKKGREISCHFIDLGGRGQSCKRIRRSQSKTY